MSNILSRRVCRGRGAINITVKEAACYFLGAASMFVVAVIAQALDVADFRSEAQRLRVTAATEGYDEGIKRVRCIGGIRYDVATGRIIDAHSKFVETK